VQILTPTRVIGVDVGAVVAVLVLLPQLGSSVVIPSVVTIIT
jgi:hypothetical protein